MGQIAGQSIYPWVLLAPVALINWWLIGCLPLC